MIARMMNDYSEPWVEPDPMDEPCDGPCCAEPLTCRTPPCPSFQEVTLTVEGVCDCRDFVWPGNPGCPVHGDQVREAIRGWNAAVKVFESAWQVAQDMADFDGRSEGFKTGWRTAVRLSMDIGADLRAQEPGVARVPR